MTQPSISRAEVRAQERRLARFEAGLQKQIVDAARARVPDVSAPPIPRTGCRALLRAARADFARSKNRHLNRATRRELAREVRLA